MLSKVRALLVLVLCPGLTCKRVLHAQVTLASTVGIPPVDPGSSACVSHNDLRTPTPSRRDGIGTRQITHLKVFANLSAENCKTKIRKGTGWSLVFSHLGPSERPLLSEQLLAGLRQQLTRPCKRTRALGRDLRGKL